MSFTNKDEGCQLEQIPCLMCLASTSGVVAVLYIDDVGLRYRSKPPYSAKILLEALVPGKKSRAKSPFVILIMHHTAIRGHYGEWLVHFVPSTSVIGYSCTGSKTP